MDNHTTLFGGHNIKTRIHGVKKEIGHSWPSELLRFCFALNKYDENRLLIPPNLHNFDGFFVIRRVLSPNSWFFGSLFVIDTVVAGS